MPLQNTSKNLKILDCPYNEMSRPENQMLLDQRREEVGLLPIKFSPSFFKKSDNEMNFPNRTQADRDVLCDELLQYLNLEVQDLSH